MTIVNDEPLCVSVRSALRLLDIGRTRFYQLLASGEIDSFRDGPKSRKIIYSSLKSYIERQLQAERQRAA